MKRLDMRLAFREEGEFVNCYFVPSLGSMKDAILMASMRATLLRRHAGEFDVFKETMTRILQTILEKFPGATVGGWTESPGPENERTKE